MKIPLLILLLATNALSAIAQTKFASHGIHVTLPEGFKTTRSGGSEFATFNMDNRVQVAFANGIHQHAEKSENKEKAQLTAEMTFIMQFTLMKDRYKASSSSSPRDTTIYKKDVKWAELNSTINGREFYMCYLLVKGKKYNYEIMYSGLAKYKAEDMKHLQTILKSYEEE